MTIEEREEVFKKDVFEAGELLYSKRMLDEFVGYWGEGNRAKKPKMRWELEKTWRLSYRLQYWARRTNGHNPYLSSAEKSILGKKKEFAKSLEPYLPKYGSELLNEFYRHWTQPENKAKPEYLRWEQETYWELSARLETWARRASAMHEERMKRVR